MTKNVSILIIMCLFSHTLSPVGPVDPFSPGLPASPWGKKQA